MCNDAVFNARGFAPWNSSTSDHTGKVKKDACGH